MVVAYGFQKLAFQTKCQKLTHLQRNKTCFVALFRRLVPKIYLGGEWGLRREVQKFGLGENGACLCDRQSSHGPCTPPSSIAPSKNIFAFTQFPENWTAVQWIEWAINLLAVRSIPSVTISPSNDGTGRWRNAGMVSWPSVSLWIPFSHSTIFANWWTFLSST